MGAICGIVRRDGAPAQPTALQHMLSAQRFWGLRGGMAWHRGPAALGCLVAHGDEDGASESALQRSDDGNLTVTFSGRLDNRADLLSELGGRHRGDARASDARLVLSAFTTWGDRCAEKLLGDWSFAAWDATQRRLVVARDPYGYTALYYYLSPGIVAFSTSLKGLLALPSLPVRISELRLAYQLIGWYDDVQLTAFEDLLRLPGGHQLTVTPNQESLNRYWKPEDTPPLTLASDDEYFEAFLEVFSSAVRCRLRGSRSKAVALSGGLDSGAVATVAARELASRNEPLLAFGQVPFYDPDEPSAQTGMPDETTLIEANARHAGNVTLHFVRSPTPDPVVAVHQQLAFHDQPQHAPGANCWFTPLAESARAHRVGVLLQGTMGNNTITWHAPLARMDHLRSWQWSWLWADLRAQNEGLLRPAWRSYVLPSLPAPLGALYAFLKRGAGGSHPPELPKTCLSQALADRLQLDQRLRQHPMWARARSDRQQRLRMIRRFEQWGSALAEGGAAFGLSIADPYCDRRVIELALAMPDSLFYRDGCRRWLLRQGVVGLLPAEVRLNRVRGVQVSDLGQRLRRSATRVEKTLAGLDCCGRVRVVLDPRKLKVLARDVLYGDGRDIRQSAAALMNGLQVAMFLDVFEKTEREGNDGK